MTTAAQNSKQILTQKGTAATPSFSFLGGNATGMYLAGTNQLGFSTAGVQAVLIDASQNVTVTGSFITPTIAGGTTASSTLTLESTTGAGTTDSILFKTGSQSTRMTIDSSGNVGIGTSTFNGVKTVIQGAQTGGAPQTSGTTQTYGLLRLKGTTFTSVLDFGTNGGNYNWIQATDSANLATNYDLAIQPNGGNVGIGTSSPSAKLQVQGSQASGTANVLYLDNSSVTGTTLASVSFSNAGSVKASIAACVAGDGYMTFNNNNNSEKMRLDASGNLLVGTTSQSFRLSVAGAATSQALSQFYSSSAGDVSQPTIQFIKTDNNTTTSQIFILFLINGGASGSGQINANGANSAAFGTYSDERLKENIIGLSPQLASICALRPVEFDYKDGSGHQIGFVAQEMQAVYPDCVGEGADDMLTITGWSKTEARLVAAIQELSTKNDALEARLAKLENV